MMLQAMASLQTRLTWSNEYTGNRTSIGRAKKRHLATASHQAAGRTRGHNRRDSVLNKRDAAFITGQAIVVDGGQYRIG